MDEVIRLQKLLTGRLVGLARATEGNEYLLTEETADLTCRALAATHPDSGADGELLRGLMAQVEAEKRRLVPSCYTCTASCGRTEDYDLRLLEQSQAENKTLRLQILATARELARQREDSAPGPLFYKALYAVGREDWQEAWLLPILEECRTGLK